MKQTNILIIDDDQALCQSLSRQIKYMGHSCVYALSLEAAFAQLNNEVFDVVFLDVRLPDGNGLDALSEIKQMGAQPEVVIVTGEGDSDGAKLAIECGAWDYLQKPLSLQDFNLQLTRILQYRAEKTEKVKTTALKLTNIVGSSQQMQDCLDFVAMAASSNANVLITGETGTGKELFSRAIHDNSKRAKKNLVVVDCAALPDSLVESILFGHIKGAFTGANHEQIGLVKQADGGTLFLDEVGELPLKVQKVFLRVLQEHSFRPVGSKTEQHSDFRLIAATNKNMEEMVELGSFRQDLLFRLKTLEKRLAPIREHASDICDIVLHHLSRLCIRDGVGLKGVSADFQEALKNYSWPGNVRELINALDIALVNSIHAPTLYARHLPPALRIQVTQHLIQKKLDKNSLACPSDDLGPLPTLDSFRQTAIYEAEKQYFEHLLSSNPKQTVQEACDASGLSRSRFYALLKKYNLTFQSPQKKSTVIT